MSGPQICLEAIIGAGKTTLGEELGKVLGIPVYHEPVLGNPFLEEFYKDPKRWAFPMQMFLMGERFRIHEEAQIVALNGKGSIVDRSIVGDRAYAKLHTREGNIDEKSWNYIYDRWFDYMLGRIRVPQVIFFLDVEPTIALDRIKERGRKAEAGIDLSYLKKLQREYYDLFSEIESGQHAWSRGMLVKRWQWNVDHQDITAMVKFLEHEFPILGSKKVHIAGRDEAPERQDSIREYA